MRFKFGDILNNAPHDFLRLDGKERHIQQQVIHAHQIAMNIFAGLQRHSKEFDKWHDPVKIRPFQAGPGFIRQQRVAAEQFGKMAVAFDNLQGGVHNHAGRGHAAQQRIRFAPRFFAHKRHAHRRFGAILNHRPRKGAAGFIAASAAVQFIIRRIFADIPEGFTNRLVRNAAMRDRLRFSHSRHDLHPVFSRRERPRQFHRLPNMQAFRQPRPFIRTSRAVDAPAFTCQRFDENRAINRRQIITAQVILQVPQPADCDGFDLAVCRERIDHAAVNRVDSPFFGLIRHEVGIRRVFREFDMRGRKPLPQILKRQRQIKQIGLTVSLMLFRNARPEKHNADLFSTLLPQQSAMRQQRRTHRQELRMSMRRVFADKIDNDRTGG